MLENKILLYYSSTEMLKNPAQIIYFIRRFWRDLLQYVNNII